MKNRPKKVQEFWARIFSSFISNVVALLLLLFDTKFDMAHSLRQHSATTYSKLERGMFIIHQTISVKGRVQYKTIFYRKIA
jgi:hypothetical protein